MSSQDRELSAVRSFLERTEPKGELLPPLVSIETPGSTVSLREEGRQGGPLWLAEQTPTSSCHYLLDGLIVAREGAFKGWIVAGSFLETQPSPVTIDVTSGERVEAMWCEQGWLAVLSAEAAQGRVTVTWNGDPPGHRVELPPLSDLVDHGPAFYAPISLRPED
jgi:hypothetical protein